MLCDEPVGKTQIQYKNTKRKITRFQFVQNEYMEYGYDYFSS